MDTDNKYGMKEIHLLLLEMLDDFLLLCEQNGIAFSMGFGSMLGAVRHKGFIPWDDDIDLIIDRANYRKLSSALIQSPFFELESRSKSSLWIPRVKRKEKRIVSSGYEPIIDLFLVDNMPNNTYAAKIKKNGVLFIQAMIKEQPNFKKGSIMMKSASFIGWGIGRLMPRKLKYWLLEKVSIFSNNKNTMYCSTYNVEYIYVGRRYNGRLLEDLIEVDFEGRKVPVSKHYDSYLKELYGDYMTPPQNNERKPKHF